MNQFDPKRVPFLYHFLLSFRNPYPAALVHMETQTGLKDKARTTFSSELAVCNVYVFTQFPIICQCSYDHSVAPIRIHCNRYLSLSSISENTVIQQRNMKVPVSIIVVSVMSDSAYLRVSGDSQREHWRRCDFRTQLQENTKGYTILLVKTRMGTAFITWWTSVMLSDFWRSPTMTVTFLPISLWETKLTFIRMASQTHTTKESGQLRTLWLFMRNHCILSVSQFGVRYAQKMWLVPTSLRMKWAEHLRLHVTVTEQWSPHCWHL
jgi:hypothetical protein